ncbi:MAG: hypothetical protein J5825_06615 [Lachnospiraceae bacterium]|nr:hypothetical protein [Lachnospiraceae bacterium]
MAIKYMFNRDQVGDIKEIADELTAKLIIIRANLVYDEKIGDHTQLLWYEKYYMRGKGTVLLSVTITQESNRQIVILVGGGGGKGLLEDTVYGSVDDLIGTARTILIKQGFVQY